MAVVQEAYVNGVSTRKVDHLVEQLGISGMSKDQVSRLCRGLDEQVQIFRERPLEGRYPYLWLDGKIEKSAIRRLRRLPLVGLPRPDDCSPGSAKAGDVLAWKQVFAGIRDLEQVSQLTCLLDALSTEQRAELFGKVALRIESVSLGSNRQVEFASLRQNEKFLGQLVVRSSRVVEVARRSEINR